VVVDGALHVCEEIFVGDVFRFLDEVLLDGLVQFLPLLRVQLVQFGVGLFIFQDNKVDEGVARFA